MTRNNYKQALETLADIAIKYNAYYADISAEVILSLNNGPLWKVNLANIQSLDEDNYNAAITCLQGKRRFGTCPQEMLENGDEILNKLKNKYKHLKS